MFWVIIGRLHGCGSVGCNGLRRKDGRPVHVCVRICSIQRIEISIREDMYPNRDGFLYVGYLVGDRWEILWDFL